MIRVIIIIIIKALNIIYAETWN